jgi:hypothetical protein
MSDREKSRLSGRELAAVEAKEAEVKRGAFSSDFSGGRYGRGGSVESDYGDDRGGGEFGGGSGGMAGGYGGGGYR